MKSPEQPAPTPQKSTFDVAKQIRAVIILGVIFTATYFISQEVRTYLGKRAAAATGLPSISLRSALQQSANANKPVLLNVAAYWCPPCRKLDNDVLSNPQVNQKITSDYVYTRIDIDSEEGQQVAQEYTIKGTPSLLVLNSDGEVLRWLNVNFQPEHFIRQL